MTRIINLGKFCGSLLLLGFHLIPGSTHARDNLQEPHPEYDVQPHNLNVTVGSDVSFTCVVNHLPLGSKVAWFHAEKKAMISIGKHLVTRNHRFSLTRRGNNTWTIHIKNVQVNDTGRYICQVNKDPQRFQFGTLYVFGPANTNINVSTNTNEDVKGEETAGEVAAATIHPPNSASAALGLYCLRGTEWLISKLTSIFCVIIACTCQNFLF